MLKQPEGIAAISPIYEMYYSMIHFFFIILILSTLFIMCYVSWTIVYFYLTSFCCLLGIPFAAFSITRQPTVMMYKSFGLQILHLIVIGMICNFAYTTITTTAESDFGLSELIYTTVNALSMAIYYQNDKTYECSLSWIGDYHEKYYC